MGLLLGMQGKTKFGTLLVLGILVCIESVMGADRFGQLSEKLQPLVRQGCVMAADEEDALFRYPQGCNPMLIPASVVKLATASMAFAELGEGYRFRTEFFLSPSGSLVIRGQGDPFLVSEEWQRIADHFSERSDFPRVLESLIFDESMFSDLSKLPGPGRSMNPYDAPNGALVSNFNTIHVRKHSNSIVESAEEQTPLTPSAEKWSRKLKPGKHRIRIPQGSNNSLRYTGELFLAFLEKEGVKVRSKELHVGKVKSEDRLLYVHHNHRNLREVVGGMMTYSNNFIANQLLLFTGMKAHGPPAVPEKGLRVLQRHLEEKLGIPEEQFHFEEGSGLSRGNRMTPEAVWKILIHYQPYRSTLPEQNGVALKTGTLNRIYTLAGYFPGAENRFFVILLNQRVNQRDAVLKLLLDHHRNKGF